MKEPIFVVSFWKLWNMRQSNIKRFAVLFVMLVLLQEPHAKLTVKLEKDGYERSEEETETKETETSEVREKSMYLVIKKISRSLNMKVIKQQQQIDIKIW